MRPKKYKNQKLDDIGDVKNIVAILVVIYAIVGGLIYEFGWIFFNLLTASIAQSSANTVTTKDVFIISGVAILLAVFLYFIRESFRLHYGLSEVTFGIICIVSGANGLSGASIQSSLIQLAGGVYIIVRGLDNIRQGLADDSRSGLIGY